MNWLIHSILTDHCRHISPTLAGHKVIEESHHNQTTVLLLQRQNYKYFKNELWKNTKQLLTSSQWFTHTDARTHARTHVHTHTLSYQFMQQPIRNIAAVVADGVGGGVAEDHGSLGDTNGRPGRLPGAVGEVHDHPQSVHLLHHRLQAHWQGISTVTSKR